MKDFIESPNPNTIDSEAADWIARLDRGGLTEEEFLALREWVNRSLEHYARLNRFAAIWRDLNGLADILEETGPDVPARKEHGKQRWLTLKTGVVITVVIIAVVTGIS